MATAPAPAGIVSVSELTRRIKIALGEEFPAVWVKGEISNWKSTPKGHCYCDLKDNFAVLPCILWASDAERLSFRPQDGAQVEAFGYVSVYEKQGKYQLYIQELRAAGLGAMLLALEALKKKLHAEGLFDPARKRPLPRYPARVGLITSPTGAAVRDMVKVLQSRWPSVRLVLAPVKVQGDGAPEQIVTAIRRFNARRAADVLIVGRGGGSTESLWAFNAESVARAIASSTIPVISAVGHEVDLTLADLAADVRAATPSNAAEIAVRDRREVEREVAHLARRMERGIRHGLATRRQRLDHLLEKHGFRRQREVFDLFRERIRTLSERFDRSFHRRLERARARLAAARDSYGLKTLPRVIAERRRVSTLLAARQNAALAAGLRGRRTRLGSCEDRLRALSPTRVLERGYCLVRAADGTLLRSAAGLAVGDPIRVEFARGDADARIEAVRPEQTE